MSIIFLTPHDPWRPDFGAAQRAARWLQALQAIAPVKVVLTDAKNPEPRAAYAAALPPPRITGPAVRLRRALRWRFCFESVRYAPRPELIQAIAPILQGAQWVVCRYLYTAAQCGLLDDPRLVIDLDDLPLEASATALAAKPLSLAARVNHHYLRRHVWSRLKHYPARLVLAKASDRQHLEGCEAFVVDNAPWGLPEHIPALPEGPVTLGFIGALDFPPNRDALLGFLAHHWPKLLRTMPSLRLIVAGRGADAALSQTLQSTPQLQFLGAVAEIGNFYQRIHAVIAPMSSGAGSSIKVVEALAYGRTVLATHFAGRGFEHYQHPKAALFTSTPEGFGSLLHHWLRQPSFRPAPAALRPSHINAATLHSIREVLR